MNDFRRRAGEKLNLLFTWSLENHPGKLIGFCIGFFLAWAFILLGFWQTLVLVGLSYLGYFLGSCWDNGELPSWLSKLVHRITLKGKK